MTQSPYEIGFPDHFDDDAPIIESKGYLGGLRIVVGNTTHRLEVYDETRLRQTIEDDLAREGFFGAAVLVVPRVTRQHIQQAVEHLSNGGFAAFSGD